MGPGILPSSTADQIKEVATVHCLALNGAICLPSSSSRALDSKITLLRVAKTKI